MGATCFDDGNSKGVLIGESGDRNGDGDGGSDELGDRELSGRGVVGT